MIRKNFLKSGGLLMKNDLFDINSYDYNLPEELIAQTPVEPRDSSKLLVLSRDNLNFEHRNFFDITDYLSDRDMIVVNNTKVIPARLYGKKETGANAEILLLEKLSDDNLWKALVRPGNKIKTGNRIIFSENLYGEIKNHNEDGSRNIMFFGENIWSEINKIGNMPLPPYIHEKLENPDRYQTKYAKIEGAVAAPTAGLHFTEKLIEKVKNKGISFEEVTLHVGLGTFRPVSENDIRNHDIHHEYYTVKKDTYDKISAHRKNGGRLIAVGTTVVRTLESVALTGKLSGDTNIYIYPPFEFKSVDALITNFHLPKSSLIMLVSAFAGYEYTMKAYKEAVDKKYRFFSFGDSMFIQ